MPHTQVTNSHAKHPTQELAVNILTCIESEIHRTMQCHSLMTSALTYIVPDSEDSPILVREKRADEMDVHSQMTENSSCACLLYRLLKLETVQSLLLC